MTEPAAPAPEPGGRPDAAAPSPRLLPIVVQHAVTGQVLMLAYGSEESLALTRETGEMHFWSRSRGKLWHKGESSGHVQRVVDLRWDCDRDALLARVLPQGPACHTGTLSCFDGPEPPYAILDELGKLFEERALQPPEGSYVARLLRDPSLLRRKVGEEAVELILAAEGSERGPIVWEAADLLFHVLVLLKARGTSLEEVLFELRRRRNPSSAGAPPAQEAMRPGSHAPGDAARGP
ncbi:MAG: bifunctional phosphoribosyl-AMP cyclohydrolase/phosphoribosyl-ATP diphosphatase HisIE [Thermoplasmata archaeon]